MKSISVTGYEEVVMYRYLTLAGALSLLLLYGCTSVEPTKTAPPQAQAPANGDGQSESGQGNGY